VFPKLKPPPPIVVMMQRETFDILTGNDLSWKVTKYNSRTIHPSA
jgi:hypothetical protein